MSRFEPIIGKRFNLREVEVKDAPFILSLRLDEKKNRFLNPTEASLEKQENYIRAYLQKNGEWYFIIEGKDQKPYGTVRIYDIIEDQSFCVGSWLTAHGAPMTAGLEGILLAFSFGFNSLGFEKSHYDVRKQNKKVINFHLRLGAEIVREDEIDCFFHLDRAIFMEKQKQFQNWLD